MAKVLTDNKHYQNIANKIRELATYHYYDPEYQEDYYMKPEDMPQGISNVYLAGELSGESYGYQWGMADAASSHPIKTLTGTEFYLTDVSELDYEIEIVSDRDTTIIACGNNLSSINDYTFTQTYYLNFNVPLPAGVYTLSGNFSTNDANGKMLIMGRYTDNEYCINHTFTTSTSRNTHTFTTTKPLAQLTFYSSTSYAASAGIKASFKDFQINRGSIAMPYEYFSGYYDGLSVRANENNIISAGYPIANIFNSNEAILEITYRRSYGAQSEYDRFWDNHPTAKGKCTGTNLFSGAGWNDVTFKPKYDIIIGSDAYMAFKDCAVSDLVKRVEEAGVSMRFDNTSSFYYTFYNSKITHIGEVPLTNSAFANSGTQTTGLCYNCSKLEKIDKIIVNNEGTTVINDNAFYGCKALKSIRFEGVIGQNLNLGACPLDTESILDIVEHLSDTATGKTLTLSQAAVNNAWFDLTYPYYQSWEEVKATKPNWTFNLV